jgi:hypothetical protein
VCDIVRKVLERFDIVRKALGMCVTSLGRPTRNVCDIVRKELRKCV